MKTINSMEDYHRELARVQADIRLLQQQMGIEPQTLEQRAKKRADRIALEQQAQSRVRPKPSWMNIPPI